MNRKIHSTALRTDPESGSETCQHNKEKSTKTKSEEVKSIFVPFAGDAAPPAEDPDLLRDIVAVGEPGALLGIPLRKRHRVPRRHVHDQVRNLESKIILDNVIFRLQRS